MSDSGGRVPDLVPARMVNEFAYCRRLFFLEWVQQRFVDNAETVDGRYQHRVVDAGGGRAPDADAPEELRSARSVLLSSPELGLVGRVDLLEGDGGTVIPVDYRRGSPPDNPERAWEPERVQLAVLGMLLRDNGYRCDHGVLWFVATHDRVEVPFDERLMARTRDSCWTSCATWRPAIFRPIRWWTPPGATAARWWGSAFPTSTTCWPTGRPSPPAAWCRGTLRPARCT